jgi:hypothetical protein
MAQWLMAAAGPPSLKCIAPYDGAVDLYREQVYHGGIHCDFMAWWYNMLRVNNQHRAANHPAGTAMPLDLAAELQRHQTYDDWWRERSAFERLHEVDIPVLSIGHWGKMGLHLRGNIVGYEEVQGPKRLIVTGARDVFEAHDLFDHIWYHEQQLLPFYDRYLKGADNGYENQAKVSIYVRGDEAYRDEKAWPLERAKYTPFYLNAKKSDSVTSLNDGSLSTTAPARNGGTTAYDYPDPKWKFGIVAMGPEGPDPIRRVLTFTSPPMDEDLEVTGPVVLELYAASTTTDTDFIVKMADQFPQSEEDRASGRQPAAINVSKGWLRAAHREKDERRSTPQRPFYTHRNPQPIAAGKVYKYEIEVMPFSNVFKKGHRIRLEIVNGDSMLTDSFFVHQYLWYKVGTDTIFHREKYPSRLLLPVVPRRSRRKR